MPELSAWIERVMAANNFTYELIMVDDGSNDKSWKVIEQLSAKDDHVRGIKFRRNYGKSAALHCGFEDARGNVVITMDADLQDSPDEIPELYRMIMEEDYDLISGWKKKRWQRNGWQNRIIRCVRNIFFREITIKIFWTCRTVG